MARYKLVDRSPRFLPIVLEAQLMTGSFEYALDYLIDNEVDLSGVAARYCNDETGAPAYDPAVMLKIVLLAYSRGVVSSRAIERLCRENVLFMAMSGDSAPQFTTIAKFVRELGGEVSAIFAQVLLICERQGLIGKQMFAIDGVKLPSNADKRRSGTHAELSHEADRMELAVAKMLAAHRARDERGETVQDEAAHAGRIERLSAEAKRIRAFLAANAERRSEKGAVRKSNVTDNDSAKMATAKGVIQGYTAVAAVDGKAQVIVAAMAHGSGSEQSVLLPMVDKTNSMRTDQTIVTADALPRENRDAPGGLLREEPGFALALHRAHEAGDRQRPGPRALCSAHRHRRTRVRQPAAQQAAGSIHAAYSVKGEYTVESILPGSQHRKAGASWIWNVGRNGKNRFAFP